MRGLICRFSHDLVFFFKQKTAYEMRISDWSSDVCSSDLDPDDIRARLVEQVTGMVRWRESVAAMADAGVDEFAEIGGKVLGAMVKRIAPDAKISSVVSISDIEAFVAAL